MKRAWLAGALVGLLGPCPFASADEGCSEAARRSLDARVQQLLARDHAAGAVLVVVRPDVVVLARGYGLADVGAGRPMSVDDTLVRPGSISKLFTGIAVQQLVEQGRLDLDRDVNGYLDFSVPTPPGGVPVTLRRLLTHRAGFEEHVKGVFARGPQPQPLGPWLARSLPRRLFPKGDVSAYSNYGVALAGYVVERVSGEPYAAYVAAHILRPLGMERSTFEQPLPPALAPLLARGYRRADRAPLPFTEVLQAAPAGALSATGADMGRFMRALLGGGALDGRRILDAEALARMTAPAVATGAGRMGLAFFEKEVGGRRVIGHDGATITFLSGLWLAPDEGLGVFASIDGAGARGTPEELVEAAFEACAAPGAAPPAPGRPENLEDAAPWAGAYQPSRRSDATLLRVNALVSQVVIAASPDGGVRRRLAIRFAGGTRFQPAGGGVYRDARGRRLAFTRGPDGHRRLHAGPPAEQWLKTPWWLDARVVVPALLASALVCLGALVTWRRGAKRVRAVLALDLAVLAATALLFRAATRDYTVLGPSLDPFLLALYATAWLAVAGSMLVPATAAGAWPRATRRGRAAYVVASLAALYLAWFFVTFRIAGTTLSY